MRLWMMRVVQKVIGNSSYVLGVWLKAAGPLAQRRRRLGAALLREQKSCGAAAVGVGGERGAGAETLATAVGLGGVGLGGGGCRWRPLQARGWCGDGTAVGSSAPLSTVVALLGRQRRKGPAGRSRFFVF